MKNKIIFYLISGHQQKTTEFRIQYHLQGNYLPSQVPIHANNM